MESLRTFPGPHLDWQERRPGQQPAAGVRVYELRGGGRVFAELQWTADAAVRAIAMAPEGLWTFERTGLFRFTRRVQISAGMADETLAVFAYAWDGLTEVGLAGGRRYLYLYAPPPTDAWIWSDGQHRVVVQTTAAGRVTLGPGAAVCPDTSLLACLGWYLNLLHAHEQR